MLRISLTLDVSEPSSINKTELAIEIGTVLGIGVINVQVTSIEGDNQGRTVAIIAIVIDRTEVGVLLSKQDPNNQLLNLAVAVNILYDRQDGQASISGFDENGLSKGAIIGIVVGSTAGILLALILLLVIGALLSNQVRRNNKAIKGASGIPIPEVTTPDLSSSHHTSGPLIDQLSVAPVSLDTFSVAPISMEQSIRVAPLSRDQFSLAPFS